MSATEAFTSPSTSSIFWRLAATAFFLFVNGFFVAAEFALVKVRDFRITKLAKEGNAKAITIKHILSHVDLYLSGCQAGITVASLVLGWLAEPAVAELIIAGAHGLGWKIAGGKIFHSISLIIALTLVTILHLTIGEQAPKMWAISRPESVAMRIVYPLKWFTIIFRPLIVLINTISNAMLKAAGFSPEDLHDGAHNTDELRAIIRSSFKSGLISSKQRSMTSNTLGLTKLQARHVFVPRVDTIFLSLENSVDENLKIMRGSGHSRFPLCRSDFDDVIGIVHAKEVLNDFIDKEEIDFERGCHPAVFVPESQSLGKLITLLQAQRKHCGIVVDEHGTNVGTIFLEDTIEEIVGPLYDEFDFDEDEVKEISKGLYEIAGKAPYPDIAELLELDPDNQCDTIAGYILSVLGRFPTKGESLMVGNYKAVILDVNQNRIQRIQFQFTEPPE